MLKTHTEFLEIATTAARMAGKLLRDGWGKPHDIHLKGATNLVTDVDRASEKTIIEYLHTVTPDFDILAEESGAHTRGSTFQWVIDPVDGTTNYAHHFPYFAVSIGLEESGESIVGVVYDPILEQLFTATQGGGAFLNGRPIRCSEAGRVADSLVATGLVYDTWESDRGIAEIVRMIKHARSVRINGSASLDLAYVACGRLDAYCDTGLFPWDISAARLLIAEAGGTFHAYGEGTLQSQFCIGSNGRIQDELQRLALL